MLTESQIKTITASNKKRIADGGGLFLELRPLKAGTGKYFVGRMRYPVGGPTIEVPIGSWGREPGQLTLKAAREEWIQLKAWSLQEGKDPRDKRRDERVGLQQQREVPTLAAYAEYFLATKSKTCKTETIKDYANILNNIVLPDLGGHTKITHYVYMNSRLRVLEVVQKVADRGSTNHASRVLMVMRQLFQQAISDGYFDGRNPADRWEGLVLPAVKHHPHLNLDELEEFIAAIQEQEGRWENLTIIGLKWTLMTFLRVSASVSLRWDQVDMQQGIWTIPGTTRGVKRTAKYSHIAHKVPLTGPMVQVLERLERLNGRQDFAFYSPRGRKNPHINPYSLNVKLRSIGYAGRLDGHGLRRTAATALKAKGWDWRDVQGQLGHLNSEDIDSDARLRAAYDANDRICLARRRALLEDWHTMLIEKGLKV